MALSNFTPESRQIVLQGDTTFQVEGLSLEDVSVLVREHLPDIEAIFEVFQSTEKMTSSESVAIVQSIVSQAPGFAANLIALASREPDAAPQAARLPFPVQVDVICTIGDLTFKETGGIKKSWELVVALLRKNRPMVTEMMAKVK